MLDYSLRLVEVLSRQGISIEKVQVLTDGEDVKKLYHYLDEYKKEFVILSRTLFLIGKQQFR